MEERFAPAGAKLGGKTEDWKERKREEIRQRLVAAREKQERYEKLCAEGGQPLQEEQQPAHRNPALGYMGRRQDPVEPQKKQDGKPDPEEPIENLEKLMESVDLTDLNDAEKMLDELYGAQHVDESLFDVAQEGEAKKKKKKKRKKKKKGSGGGGGGGAGSAPIDKSEVRISPDELAKTTKVPPKILALMKLNEEAKCHLGESMDYLERHDLDGAVAEFDVAETKYKRVLATGVAKMSPKVWNLDRLFKLCKGAIDKEVIHKAKRQHNVGAEHFQQGDYDRAISFYRLAIVTNPKFFESHYCLGIALKTKGDRAQDPEEKKASYDQSVSAYRKALKYDPNWSCSGRVYNNLGLVLECMGDTDGAAEAFKAGIDAEPTYARTHSNYGNILLRRGQTDEAIASFQKAVDSAPECATTHFNLAVAYKNTHDYPRAIASFEQAVECDPKWADAHYGLGGALFESGEPDIAMECWEEAIRVDPNHKPSLAALEIEKGIQEQNAAFLAAARASLNAGATAAAAVAAAQAAEADRESDVVEGKAPDEGEAPDSDDEPDKVEREVPAVAAATNAVVQEIDSDDEIEPVEEEAAPSGPKLNFGMVPDRDNGDATPIRYDHLASDSLPR
jgi:tetratricopeptide (TPR) repeat protein